MAGPPSRPIVRPGDITVSAVGGGPGWMVSRVVDARPDSWQVWHLGSATTEAGAIALARRARAEAAIWLRPDLEKRRARRVRDGV